jgi:hypothetical protein
LSARDATSNINTVMNVDVDLPSGGNTFGW